MSDLVEVADVEEAIFQARVAGKSVRSLVKQFGVSAKEVERICLERLPEIDDAARRKALGIELERLDALLAVFLRKAVEESDVPSAGIVLKICERRAAYLGLDRPVKVDPVVLRVEPQMNSTERIKAALDAIAKQAQLPPPPEPNGSEPPPS
jgi:hypothetical protein